MAHFRNNDIILTREEVEVFIDYLTDFMHNTTETEFVREEIIKTARETRSIRKTIEVLINAVMKKYNERNDFAALILASPLFNLHEFYIEIFKEMQRRKRKRRK